ncbi:ATP/GTP-binding protein [Corynebacterium choanae]|uniref:ATPase AAA-type core domain-containing protein n=1 Tax=Corynebacterium choanae TaxID=1862358 RepID=A0A3G6J5N3_9CORY|nr:ATP-binding protein [Corynebacterium choanae]AZA13246.1 hypothetical protein CCHOA_04185 [Corynebacterium choanae]
MLLLWTISNFGSFHGEVTLDLRAPGFSRNLPRDGDWYSNTNRVIALYGANASGKSTALLSLAQAALAIRTSIRWGGYVEKLRNPHMLNQSEPSSFEAEYASAGIRYRWRVSLTDAGIAEESLEANDKGRWKLIFTRTDDRIDFGTASGIGRADRHIVRNYLHNWCLALSAWETLKNPGAYAEASSWWLTVSMVGVLPEVPDHVILERIFSHKNLAKLAPAAMQAADLGISRIELAEEEAPAEIAAAVRALNKVFLNQMETSGAEGEETDAVDIDEIDSDNQGERILRKYLRFNHDVAGGDSFQLAEDRESAGTRTWFHLIHAAILRLLLGGVFIVDELDSSLHPYLTDYLVSLFQDPEVNRSGAQLLFTTHDTTLLAGTRAVDFHPSSVWFVEKLNSISSLYCLADFEVRKNHNIERRYLQGRFGAVPFLNSDIRQALIDLPIEVNDERR